MNKMYRLIFIVILTCSVISISDSPVHADVKTSLKKGVFTVSGSGKMKSSQIVSHKNKLKVKKVIIKKGVTSIPDNAFKNCSNLKTVKIAATVKSLGSSAFSGTAIKALVIPKKVKVIHENLFDNCNYLKTVTLRGDFTLRKWYRYQEDHIDYMSAKTFAFSTPLDINNIRFLRAENIKVCTSDPYFTSVNGVIYTKDKKTLVRIPSERTDYNVEQGCETIAASALNYAPEDWYDIVIDGIVCANLKTLRIPSSVKTISLELFPNIENHGGYSPCHSTNIEKIYGTDSLDGESFSNLLYISNHNMMKSLIDTADEKGYLIKTDKLTTYKNDHLLLLDPDEDESEIDIPAGIKTIGTACIGAQLVYDGNYKKNIHIGTLLIGKDVESIGRAAFSYTGSMNSSIVIDKLIINEKLIKALF